MLGKCIQNVNDDFECIPFSSFVFRYKKDQDIAFLATCSLHSILNCSLLSESGPPMIDFEVIHAIVFLLKKMVSSVPSFSVFVPLEILT